MTFPDPDIFTNPQNYVGFSLRVYIQQPTTKTPSIMTYRGAQFYSNEKEAAKNGASRFEKRLVELGIRKILAGINHPQTNGKLERLHVEIQRKLPNFEAIMMRKSNPIDLFMDWYNDQRPHMSLDFENLETPVQALQERFRL